MIDPETAAKLSRRIVALFRDAEERVFMEVARRLSRGLASASWAADRIAETSALRRRVEAVIVRLQKATPAEVAATIEQAWKLGESVASTELAAARVKPEAPFAVLPQTEAIDALTAELERSLETTYLRILRSAEDAYRSVIAEVVAEGMTGAYTRRTAAQAALDRFAVRGVSGFVDRLGRQWSLASYTEMAVRTTTAHAALEAKAQRYAASGWDLVRVSDAPGECGICRPWEGRVLSLNGRTPGYPTLAEARAAGLFHGNCRHGFGLYEPGLSKPIERSALADPEGEEARERQRYLERGIRSWKLREAAAMDPAAQAKAQAKVREWQARLREHIDATGGKRLRYREQVGGAI